MTFEESLNARHACKKFSDKAISSKDLDFILEAGRHLPPVAMALSRGSSS